MTNSPILYVETTYAIADAGSPFPNPSAPPRPCEAGTSAGQAESLAQKRNRLMAEYAACTRRGDRAGGKAVYVDLRRVTHELMRGELC